MTRADAVRALLASLFDYLPGPKTSSFGGLSGPAPSTKAPCRACSGAGTFGRKRRRCAACDGQGVVVVDAYTGEPVGTDEGHVHAADARRIDAELRALARDEAIRRGRLLDDPFRWEAERIRYRRSGSYDALERLLEAMKATMPGRHGLVMRCLVYGTVEPSPDATAALDEAVEWLAARMPTPIRVPRWVSPGRADKPGKGRWANQHAQGERNAQIRRLASEGWTQARIGAEFGLSQRAVSKVLAAGTAA